jgi:drug/metabolite transporter (DMT)-like permease
VSEHVAHRATRAAAWAPWAALVVVYVVWGSTYLAIRVSVQTVPPFMLAGVRYVLAGTLLYPVAVRMGGPQRRQNDRPGARQWLAAAIIGTLLLTFGNGGVSYGEQSVESGLAALLVATVPLWMLAADRILNGRTITLRATAALLLGVIGVAVLAHPGPAGKVSGVLIILAASASWGTGSVLSQRLALPARPLVSSGMEMLAGGAVLLVLSVVSGEWWTFRLDQVSWASLAALLYLIGPGSLLALSCYLFALKSLPTSTVATYAFVNPLVAVVLGTWLLDEHLTLSTFLGAAILTISVTLAITARPRSQP